MVPAAAHAESIGDLFAALESTSAGLPDDEADRRLQQLGLNRFDRTSPISPLLAAGITGLPMPLVPLQLLC